MKNVVIQRTHIIMIPDILSFSTKDKSPVLYMRERRGHVLLYSQVPKLLTGILEAVASYS